MRLPFVAAAFTGVQVGTGLIMSEAAVSQVGAGRLGFLRYAIALLFILPFVLRENHTRLLPRDLLPVALIGIGQFGVLTLMLNFAVLYSGSALSSLVFATLPLVTVAISWLTFKTRIGRRDLVAITLTIIGVGVLLGGDAFSGALTLTQLAGITCAGVATFTGAICSVLYAPYLRRYGVVKISAVAMAASLIPLGAIALTERTGVPVTFWTKTTFLLVGLIGLSSGVGFLMWLYALAKAPAGIVSAFLALSPVMTVSFSIAFLNLSPTIPLFTSLILIIGGLVVMATLPNPQKVSKFVEEKSDA